jgi:hypothetical protein
MKNPSELLLQSEVWSESYPRWVIRNWDQTYWNESNNEFISNRNNATKYEDSQSADAEIYSILIKAYEGPGTHKTSYIVPVVIDVYGDPKLSEDKIVDYVMESITLNLDSYTHGNGPDGNLILPRIEWCGFKKREKK